MRFQLSIFQMNVRKKNGGGGVENDAKAAKVLRLETSAS